MKSFYPKGIVQKVKNKVNLSLKLINCLKNVMVFKTKNLLYFPKRRSKVMITYNEENRTFKLNTPNTTYMIGIVDEENFIGHIYY